MSVFPTCGQSMSLLYGYAMSTTSKCLLQANVKRQIQTWTHHQLVMGRMQAYLRRVIEGIFDFAYPKDNHNRPRFSMAPFTSIQYAGKAESCHGRQGTTGFEPVTSRSAVECSSTELCPQVKRLAWTNKSGHQSNGQRTQDGLILLFQAPNHPKMCRYRLKISPITALAGNRTRASRVAGENSTTEPPVPVWKL